MVEPKMNEDQILEDLLTETRSEHEPEMREALASSPALRAKLDSLRAQASRLERIAAVDTADIERELQRRRFDPETVVREAVGRSKIHRFPWGTVLATAAAAALVIGLLLQPTPTQPGTGDAPQDLSGVYLSEEYGRVDYSPANSISAGQVFEWTVEMPPEDSWRFKIYGVKKSDGSRGKLLYRKALSIETSKWTIPNDELKTLPAKLIWAMEAVNYEDSEVVFDTVLLRQQ